MKGYRSICRMVFIVLVWCLAGVGESCMGLMVPLNAENGYAELKNFWEDVKAVYEKYLWERGMPILWDLDILRRVSSLSLDGVAHDARQIFEVFVQKHGERTSEKDAACLLFELYDVLAGQEGEFSDMVEDECDFLDNISAYIYDYKRIKLLNLEELAQEIKKQNKLLKDMLSAKTMGVNQQTQKLKQEKERLRVAKRQLAELKRTVACVGRRWQQTVEDLNKQLQREQEKKKLFEMALRSIINRDRLY